MAKNIIKWTLSKDHQTITIPEGYRLIINHPDKNIGNDIIIKCPDLEEFTFFNKTYYALIKGMY